jgi:hypothetical protein
MKEIEAKRAYREEKGLLNNRESAVLTDSLFLGLHQSFFFKGIVAMSRDDKMI